MAVTNYIKRKQALSLICLLTLLNGIAFFVGRRSVKDFPSLTFRKSTVNYRDNISFQMTRLYAPLYTGHYDYVMFGDSHTNNVRWNEVLNRCDVAVKGVGGDITEGYLNRIGDVLSCTPKTCFVEGGINDIVYDVDLHTINANLTRIVDTLQAHNVTPVLFKVIYVAQNYPNAVNVNWKVGIVNQFITLLCTNKKLACIDLNPFLSQNGFLAPANAVKDGCHLSPQAYMVWREQMQKYLPRP